MTTIRLIETPTRFPVPDDQALTIDEHVGRINTGTPGVSIARLRSGPGWSEPAQRPEFDEYTFVLSGEVHIQNGDDGTTTIVRENQVAFTPKGLQIQYSTPHGADYIAVCLPAFTMEAAHREAT